MKFPNMLYKCPGSHQCPGGSFDYTGVDNQTQADALIKAGWRETLPEAMNQKYGTPIVQPVVAIKDEEELEVLGDDSPPTRAELEQQASELGIKFKKTTSDQELSKKIDEALEN